MYCDVNITVKNKIYRNMKKVKNPYVGQKGYSCIGCDPDHPFGVRLNFTFDEVNKVIYSEWNPTSDYEGYRNVLHGGIQALLLDEIGGWAINTILGTAGVTSQMHVRYRKPVHISYGPIKLKAWMEDSRRGFTNIKTELYDGKGDICAEAKVQYYAYPPDVAMEEFDFPGAECFFV